MKGKRVTQRQIQSQKTRDKIYKTALNLFAKYGYDKVRVDDIVRYSKVSKGSFYTHFKSKYHIMLEQYRKIDDAYLRWFQTFSPTKSASEQLVSFFQSQAAFFMEESLDLFKVVYSVEISQSTHIPKFLIDETRPYYKIIAAIIKLGVEQNEFRNDISIEDLMRKISRFARGLLYDWCLFEGSFDLKEASQNYFTLILDMLKKRADQVQNYTGSPIK